MAGFLLMFLLPFTSAFDLSLSTDKYARRREDRTYVGEVLENVVARSTTHCAAVCSRNDHCRVIIVCPRNGSLRQVDCSLLGDVSFQDGSLSEILQGCFQMEKVQAANSENTSTESVSTMGTLKCKNGGTPTEGGCQCPRYYGGSTCQRLVRDCTEPVDIDWTLPEEVTPILIQPVGASKPFWILCSLDNAGSSYVIMRTARDSFNMTWTTAKNLMGDNSSSLWYDQDYFVGLDNLHQILSQGYYWCYVDFEYDCETGKCQGRINYYNFSVGPESSSYPLSYLTSWSPLSDSLEDGLSTSSPLTFSTPDHDPKNCSRGYPGWFGSDCSGYSFFSDTMTWPVNGTPTMKTTSGSDVKFCLNRLDVDRTSPNTTVQRQRLHVRPVLESS